MTDIHSAFLFYLVYDEVMQDTKRVWAWVGGAIVVLAVIVYFVWPKIFAKAPTTPANAPVYAAQGQVTPQFPQALILDSNVAVTNSYAISYSSSTNLSTAMFNASTSMQVLYTSYKQYLLSNNWTITNDVTSSPALRELYGVNASSEVNIAIIQKGTGSQVTIGYLTK